VGGNVSFYNETDGIDIYPTPIIGLIGLADPYPEHPPRLDRADPGMDLWLLGPDRSEDLAGSIYQKIMMGAIAGRPSEPDPDMALRVTGLATGLAAGEITPVLHDVSVGGIALAVAKVCILSGVGARLEWQGNLFAEDPHRLVSAIAPEHADQMVAVAAEAGVPVRRIGTFGGDEIRFESSAVDLERASRIWRTALPRRMG